MNHQGEIVSVSPIDWTAPSWTRSTLTDDQVITWTKAKVHVCSDSTICLGKMHEHSEANQRWKNQVGEFRQSNSWREFDTVQCFFRTIKRVHATRRTSTRPRPTHNSHARVGALIHRLDGSSPQWVRAGHPRYTGARGWLSTRPQARHNAYTTELFGIDEEPIEFELTIFPELTSLGILQRTQKDLQDKNIELANLKIGSSSCQCSMT